MFSFRRSVLSGLAFLGFAFTLIVSAGTLREEAVSYRTSGYEAQQRGDRDEAYAYYKKAIALDAAYPTPYNDMGIILEEQGDLRAAEQSYQHAIKLNPKYLEPHANLAMLYERMGDRKRSIEFWMQRVQMGDANDPLTLRAQARLLALGVPKSHPGLYGGERAARRLIANKEFQDHAVSADDFRAITEAHGQWP